MAIKNIRLGRAEDLPEATRDLHKLQSSGLIIIETHNPELKEKMIQVDKDGIRGYLLKQGKFTDTQIDEVD